MTAVLTRSQRRILVAMNDLNLSPASHTTKCAGIVGETMKRSHPHGDGAIYDVVKQIIVASLQGHPLPLVIEAARSGIQHQNQPAFAEAFGCKEGDKMVRSGEDRVVIW